MIAEILATGNEVLSGAIADTNAAHIAQVLEAAGIEVRRHTCVGDDLDHIAAAVTEICARADVLLVTGGLGPTGDDLTTEAVARAAGKKLVLDPEAEHSMKTYFVQRKRSMQPSDAKQAMLPEGAQCIVNAIGTAPGFMLAMGHCHVFVMPGVPHEMKQILETGVLPRIETLQGGGRLYAASRILTVFGLPESTVGERMAGFDAAFPSMRYGIRVKFPEIFIKVSTRQPDARTAQDLAVQACQWVKKQVGESVFSDAGLALEAEVGRLLVSAKATVAVAESCTGGLIADLLTGVPGSSDYFLFSGVTYANQAKVDVLGVSPQTIETHGAVSEETVKEMADGVRRVAGATFGLATSGIAGPSGGTREKPVGTVCIGLAGPDGVQTSRVCLSFQNRSMNKRLFAFLALETLRRKLLQLYYSKSEWQRKNESDFDPDTD